MDNLAQHLFVPDVLSFMIENVPGLTEKLGKLTFYVDFYSHLM